MRRHVVPFAIALTAVLAVLSAVFWHPAIGTAAGQQIIITTEPPLSQIHPHGGPNAGIAPEKLFVEARDAAGNPIPNVLFDLQMDAPPTNWFISTDVPLVEGKTLLNLRGVAPNGRFELDYTFPIRGTYRFSVKASPAPGTSASFTPFNQSIDLPISEKPSSFLNLGLFLLVLFSFGLLSGIVIGRSNAAAQVR